MACGRGGYDRAFIFTSVWGVALLLLPLPRSANAAQPVLRVDSVAECRSCRIETGPPIELRGEFELGSVLDLPVTVARAEDGLIYVVYGAEPYTIYIHGPDGSYTNRRFGREGAGPGEFRFINYLLVRDDVLHAFDVWLQRRTDIDLRSGAVITTSVIPVGGAMRYTVLDGGKSVIGGPVALRQTAGQPLHVYGVDGTWERSFGLETPVLLPDRAHLHLRLLEPAGNSTLWAAPINEYRVELWRSDGTLLRTLAGERGWFAPWHDPELLRLTRERPLPPRLGSIALDDDGLLWVFLGRSAEDWASHFEDTTAANGSAVRRENARETYVILEVIDPETGRLVYRAEQRGSDGPIPIGNPAGNQTLWSARFDELGLPRVRLIPYRLVGR